MSKFWYFYFAKVSIFRIAAPRYSAKKIVENCKTCCMTNTVTNTFLISLNSIFQATLFFFSASSPLLAVRDSEDRLFPIGSFKPLLLRQKNSPPTGGLFGFHVSFYLKDGVVSFWMTSWAPPSTMLVDETRVRTAFSCSSGIVSAPQLHIVCFTLLSVRATLSFRDPA